MTISKFGLPEKGRFRTWTSTQEKAMDYNEEAVAPICEYRTMCGSHRVLPETRPVWTDFKIAARHKLLTHNNTRLYTAYKKAIVNIIIMR